MLATFLPVFFSWFLAGLVVQMADKKTFPVLIFSPSPAQKKHILMEVLLEIGIWLEKGLARHLVYTGID